tara:strand:+ start:165 stop:1103 length:939 start_codon:yes stop_codon:yes gene_type:complete
MINTVRNTVLSVLNKNNYGYLSPSDFNLFSKQAQMDIFESYFYQYNYQINKENKRSSGTGYADITKGLEEVIDEFSKTDYLRYSNANKFFLPSETTTGEDFYLINKILAYQTFRVNGAITSVSANQLVDLTATFTATVAIGDVVVNTTTYSSAEVTAIVSDTVLSLDGDIFTSLPGDYSIFSSVQNEAERVSHSKITMLNSSPFTAPSEIFPVYTEESGAASIFPKKMKNDGQVLAQYIRYPKEPKWTYIVLANGEPAFDASQSDYQDFELPLDDEVTLVTKILQYAGISIREASVSQFANGEEQKENQTQA